MNHYWSLVRPVVVRDTNQEWSRIGPVLLGALTTTGSFHPLYEGLYRLGVEVGWGA